VSTANSGLRAPSPETSRSLNFSATLHEGAGEIKGLPGVALGTRPGIKTLGRHAEMSPSNGDVGDASSGQYFLRGQDITPWRHELESDASNPVIPTHPLQDPACWMGRDLRRTADWQYRFSAADLDELSAALAHVRRQGLELVQITKADFALPRLGRTLADIRREVLEGRGFALLRGLPVEESRHDAAVLYWGLGTHFGFPVSQNGRGQLLGHVIDLGETSMAARRGSLDASPEEQPFIHTAVRGYNSRARLFFHVDYCDVVGLLCMHPARRGGTSQIVSSIAIHNAILAQRPDLLKVLYEPFWATRYNEVPVGAKPYYRTAIFNYVHGRLLTKYVPQVIRVAPDSFAELPPLSAKQLEALDLFDTLANDADFQLGMDLEQGDVQLLHNHVVLHSRTAFEDYADSTRKRHLLRLWLVTPDGAPLPDSFYEHYRSGRRGGVYVPGMAEVASLDP
jgi:Taurine catabolism dioxygenase TauD, TfdA family